MEPLLSICIPTYNRSKALKESLERYVTCEGFDESVEIVISDNASTDDTEEIAKSFSLKYKNIKYYKNDKNINDANFEAALKRGKGKYLKLQNDTTLFNPQAFVYMKKCLSSSNENIPVFFTNDFIYTNYKGNDEIKCNSFDEYIKCVSTYVTAISCFGVWRNQLGDIKNFIKYSELKLNQDDWTYQLLEKYNSCIIYNAHYYDGIAKKTGGYHWFQVHLDNYYTIMNPYIKKGLISKSTYENDKKNLFKHFIPELKNIYITHTKDWEFEKEGTFKIFWKYYKANWYFYVVVLFYPIMFVGYKIIHYFKSIEKYMLKRLTNVK